MLFITSGLFAEVGGIVVILFFVISVIFLLFRGDSHLKFRIGICFRVNFEVPEPVFLSLDANLERGAHA